jgi:hypothetical protein
LLTTTQPTNVTLELLPSGNPAVMFEGGVHVSVEGAPDPVFERGGVDLYQNVLEAGGYLFGKKAQLFTSSYLRVDLNSGNATARGCVLFICKTVLMPAEQKEKK